MPKIHWAPGYCSSASRTPATANPLCVTCISCIGTVRFRQFAEAYAELSLRVLGAGNLFRIRDRIHAVRVISPHIRTHCGCTHDADAGVRVDDMHGAPDAVDCQGCLFSLRAERARNLAAGDATVDVSKVINNRRTIKDTIVRAEGRVRIIAEIYWLRTANRTQVVVCDRTPGGSQYTGTVHGCGYNRDVGALDRASPVVDGVTYPAHTALAAFAAMLNATLITGQP